MSPRRRNNEQLWRNRIVDQGMADPATLLPHPENWRTHPVVQQQALAGALNEVGWVQRVIVNRTTGHMLDGHLRVAMALERRVPEVPVSYVELEEHEEKLVLLMLDPMAGMAESDKEKLGGLLAAVQTGEAGLQQLLADLASENDIEGGGGAGGGTGDAASSEVPPARTTDIQTGDVIIMGRHRLICGDATDPDVLDRLFNGESADCVFTSPPYAVGVDYGDTYEDTIDSLREMLPKLAALWARLVVAGGFAVLNFGDIAAARKIAGTDEPCEYPMALEYWPVFRAEGWLLWSRRVWVKPTPRVHSMQCIGSNRAATDWEHVWTWKRPGEPILARLDGEISSVNGWIDSTRAHGVDVGKDEHGAGMAVVVADRAIAIHSRFGSIVHEPFCGTGTTLIVAEASGRRCLATELSPTYCQMTVDRWEAFTNQKASIERADSNAAE